MGPKRIRIALAVSALVVAAGLLLLLFPRRSRPGPDTPAPQAQARASAPALGLAPGAGAPPAAGDRGRSELANGLNATGGNAQADMRIIDGIFIAFRSALRTGNPIGENAEITAALSGRNKLGFAFLPADNPAINAKGELCDRWGTPYFFHQLSGERMEIRSAGPDRTLWTEDDVIFTP